MDKKLFVGVFVSLLIGCGGADDQLGWLNGAKGENKDQQQTALTPLAMECQLPGIVPKGIRPEALVGQGFTLDANSGQYFKTIIANSVDFKASLDNWGNPRRNCLTSLYDEVGNPIPDAVDPCAEGTTCKVVEAFEGCGSPKTDKSGFVKAEKVITGACVIDDDSLDHEVHYDMELPPSADIQARILANPGSIVCDENSECVPTKDLWSLADRKLACGFTTVNSANKKMTGQVAKATVTTVTMCRRESDGTIYGPALSSDQTLTVIGEVCQNSFQRQITRFECVDHASKKCITWKGWGSVEIGRDCDEVTSYIDDDGKEQFAETRCFPNAKNGDRVECVGVVLSLK